jgi:hypothetical protein
MVVSTLVTGVAAIANPGWEAISNGAQDGKGFQNITGFGWNAPFNGLANVGMTGSSDTVRKELAIFSYLHDGNRAENPTLNSNDAGTPPFIAALRPEGQTMQNPNAEEREQTPEVPDFRVLQFNQIAQDAVNGAERLRDVASRNSFVIPNIVSSKASNQWGWAPTDLKMINDSAGDVFFGAEFMPASAGQMPNRLTIIDPVLSISAIPEGAEPDQRAYRANDSRVNISGRPGATVDAKVAAYKAEMIAEQQAVLDSEASDADAKAAATEAIKVYQADTSMLTFARGQVTYGGVSYYAARVGGVWDTLLSEGRDFWLFGASGNNIVTYGNSQQATLDGMKSGNNYVSQGNLISSLDYRIGSGEGFATMGQRLNPINGEDTVVTIRFKGNGVDHIDLIGGTIGSVPSRNVSNPGVTYHPLHRLTNEYKADTTSSASLVKRFEKSEFTTDEDGFSVVTYTLTDNTSGMYYRIRGTSNSISAAGYDSNGAPAADSGSVNGQWFYSNPIFIGDSINDGVRIDSTITDSNENPIANRTLTLTTSDFTVMTTGTDSNGNFSFNNNIPVGEHPEGTHTLELLDDNGDVESSLTFNLDRWEETFFDEASVWIATDVMGVNMEFMSEGADISILSVTDGSKPPGGLPNDDDDDDYDWDDDDWFNDNPNTTQTTAPQSGNGSKLFMYTVITAVISLTSSVITGLKLKKEKK